VSERGGLSVARRSAGLLLYRRTTGPLEVLLVHPGGPFWARRDSGVWSIPKGEHEPDEDPLTAAFREFNEELGGRPDIDPEGLLELGAVRQASGKIVLVWAGAAEFDATTITSNTFEMEWPPRSGRSEEFPEVDRAAWFDLATARSKIVPSQAEFIDRLADLLARQPPR
jgi:predicted NUDIX family NTP pyrophosphohydrolase